jgi:ABC-2 type transport system permease protein
VKREGSPWTGLWAVVLKELADHLSSVRMLLLEILMLLTALGTVYAATQTLRDPVTGVGEDPFIYLRIFTTTYKIGEQELSFISFIVFLVPLVAIALAFDAINGEYNRRTLSRVLAQPIYRDAVLMGKFLAGLFTIAITLVALWLLVTGLGIWRLGVVPEMREVGRGLAFLFATVAYGGVWLALAMLFSVVFRQPATSALATLAVWLFYLVFWDILATVLGGMVAATGVQNELQQAQFLQFLSRLSPNTLYGETVLALLNPGVRTLGPLMAAVARLEAAGLIPQTVLPLSQSLLLVWPQLTAMIGAAIVLFAYTYVLFQRQEVRA